MPREKGWTKIPNRLLDALMPRLGDTELRVLLVILRSTAGWNREGQPVTLTYDELMRRTGRKGEAVANALRRLTERQLIHSPANAARRNANGGASESERQQTKTG